MVSGGSARRVAAIYVTLAGLQRGVAFLILPFVVGVMPPAEYGQASVLAVTGLLVTTLLGAPLEQLVLRAAAKDDATSPAKLRVAGIYLYALLPAALVILGAGVGLVCWLVAAPAGYPWAIELAAAGLVSASSAYAMPYVRARWDLRRFVILALISIVVSVLARLIFVVWLQFGVLGWAMSDFIAAAVAAVAAVLIVRLPRARVTRAIVEEVARFAFPLVPHQASFWAINSLSRPAMALVSPLAQVGFLALGQNIASIAALILGEVNRAVLPRYAIETFPAPTATTRGANRWQMALFLVVPAMVAAGTALFGNIVFPPDYAPAFAATGILLIGQAAYGLYLLPMNYIVMAAGRPKLSGIASAAGAAVTFVGVLALAPSFGAIGAALASTAGLVVLAGVAFVISSRLQLAVDWRAVFAGWPGMVAGCIALAVSVTALFLDIGSLASVGMGIAGLALACSAVLLSRYLPARPKADR